MRNNNRQLDRPTGIIAQGAVALGGMIAALLLLVSSAEASANEDPTLPHERYKLENGLEVILHRDSSVPLVAVNVWFHVGSGDEVPQKSGFAHLFEHMMFQGSEHTGQDVHFKILKKIGASGANGSTNSDRTNYYQVVPSHQLEVALWLESDRMGYMLPLLNKKSFANQQEVVRNERRQSYENRPYGRELLATYQELYAANHPYRHLTIGRHEDLVAASVKDVRDFFRAWYVPANATLTLAGDFDTEKAKTLIQKWFGSFPKSTKPAHQPVPPSLLKSPKTKTVSDPLAKLRRLRFAWHTPKFFASGDAELDVAATTLSRYGSGRLYKILVHKKQLAQSVSAYQLSAQFSSVFSITVDLKPDAPLDVVRSIVDTELERLRKEVITKAEFHRAVVEFETHFVWGLESLSHRADLLQRYNHYVDTPDYITQDLDRYRKTSAEQIRQACARYLPTEQRVEILTLPATASPRPAPGSKRASKTTTEPKVKATGDKSDAQ